MLAGKKNILLREASVKVDCLPYLIWWWLLPFFALSVMRFFPGEICT